MAFGRQWCTVLPGGPLNLPLCCSRPFAGSAAAAAALKLLVLLLCLFKFGGAELWGTMWTANLGMHTFNIIQEACSSSDRSQNRPARLPRLYVAVSQNWGYLLGSPIERYSFLGSVLGSPYSSYLLHLKGGTMPFILNIWTCPEVLGPERSRAAGRTTIN